MQSAVSMARLHMICRIVLFCAFLSTSAYAQTRPSSRSGDALAMQTRVALLIGANRGDTDEQPLRYAVRDAQRMARTLIDLGGFKREHVQVLRNPTQARVQAQLAALRRRLVSLGGDILLFVYYSGHADAVSMHVSGQHVPWGLLRTAVKTARAPVRVLVVDACRSGEVTRVKGLRRLAPDGVSRKMVTPRGFAVLASSSAEEDAQESDSLRSSFFTHHFVSGLRGAADHNQDGKVTLSEVYHYAAQRTVASTASSWAGVQHPTYRYELKGHGAVVLAQKSDRLGLVLLTRSGQYFFHRRQRRGPLVLEAHVAEQARQVWLQEGRYVVRLRGEQGFYETTMRVRAHASHQPQSWTRVDLARLALKGQRREHRFGLSLWGGAASPYVSNYPWAVRLALQGTLRVDWIAFDLQLHTASAKHVRRELSAHVREASLAVGARHVIDWDRLSLSTGLRVGLGLLWQRFESERALQPFVRLMPWFSPTLRLDMRVWKNWYCGLQSELRVMALTSTSDGVTVDGSPLRLQGVFEAGMGASW